MKTIVLTGGGTAGHVNPNIALMPSLKEQGFDIHYLGTAGGMERGMIQDIDNVTYHIIRSGKLRRYFSLQNFSDPFKVIGGYFDAKKILKKVKPSVVFSKGGFVSVPVVLAAKSLKIPTILHESDYTPGLANKILLTRSDKILVTFEDTLKYIKNNGIFTGTPIRKELYSGNKNIANELFKTNKPVLLCTGGSQGAQALNNALRQNLDKLLKRYNIIHLCGKNNLDSSLNSLEGYYQLEFATSQMRDFLAASDIILSRAGANSVFEFLALNKPALLIPLPSSTSRGDQVLNSQYFANRGYSMVLDQENISQLVKNIDELYQNREKLQNAMKQAKNADGTAAVLTQLLQMVK